MTDDTGGLTMTEEMNRGSDEQSDLDVVEEAGIAFNPETQGLDLSKEEKRRTTALMMAIQAYRELIIKEAAYLREASELARRGEGPALQPATIDAMINAAWKFDVFISGGYHEAATAAKAVEKVEDKQPLRQEQEA